MVPGKLYEYLDAGRPLVALLPERDEAAELARRAGATVLPPAAPEPLAAAIESAWLSWKNEGRRPDARPAWLDQHTRASLAQQLAVRLDALPRGAA
jgi:hypothetical protein